MLACVWPEDHSSGLRKKRRKLNALNSIFVKSLTKRKFSKQMDGPKVALHLDGNGNVFYGWQVGLRLVSIYRSFKFNGKIWLLVYWEGYDLLEAVPLALMPKKFHAVVIAFIQKNENH
ncbi:hypothetical protein ACLKA7_006126 [Drosophila subpalustris]